MLSPKKVKWRKQQKGRMKGAANRGNTITFGDMALQAWSVAILPIARSRRLVSRPLERPRGLVMSGSKIFPDKSLTKKPAEVRMGKG